MEVNKIISHALQSMPPSKRQKAFAKDTSKTDPYGIKRKQLRNVTEGSGGTGGLYGGKPFLS